MQRFCDLEVARDAQKDEDKKIENPAFMPSEHHTLNSEKLPPTSW
jgi:hypothetical protein